MTRVDDADKEPAERTIAVERTIGDARAEGRAVVRKDEGRHARLAGARAWAALGRTRQAVQAFEEAVAAARAGIEELGRDYAPPEALDDTDLKRAAAEEQYQRGRVDRAAEGLLRVLEARLRLYATRHAEALTTERQATSGGFGDA